MKRTHASVKHGNLLAPGPPETRTTGRTIRLPMLLRCLPPLGELMFAADPRGPGTRTTGHAGRFPMLPHRLPPYRALMLYVNINSRGGGRRWGRIGSRQAWPGVRVPGPLGPAACHAWLGGACAPWHIPRPENISSSGGGRRRRSIGTNRQMWPVVRVPGPLGPVACRGSPAQECA